MWPNGGYTCVFSIDFNEYGAILVLIWQVTYLPADSILQGLNPFHLSPLSDYIYILTCTIVLGKSTNIQY